MRIESQETGALTLQQQRRAEDKNVQCVFTEVLATVDREGYQSAAPADTDPAAAETVDGEQDLDDKIQQAWDSWYSTELRGRYQSAENTESTGAAFGELLVRANDEGGYADPKGFLNTLSNDELEVVRRVHWLADPIDVDSISEEGALNLLIPPAAQVDLNRDGITQSGAANGIRFPSSTTPADVVEAWETATEGMDWGQRAIYEFQMMLPLLTANMSFNSDGTLAHRYEPGDPGFTNPMADPEYSYVQAAQDRLDYLEAFKSRIDPIKYQADKDFWSEFQSLLRQGA